MIAYDLAWFDYIITATFLPVIARTALRPTASVRIDHLWPAFGIGAVIGSLLVARVDKTRDPRLALAVCYVIEALGVAGAIDHPKDCRIFVSWSTV